MEVNTLGNLRITSIVGMAFLLIPMEVNTLGNLRVVKGMGRDILSGQMAMLIFVPTKMAKTQIVLAEMYTT